MTARHPIWLCLILVCVAQPASRAPAADYYVDPRAGEDDNDGSIGAPWKHLSIAGRRLRPGDAVHLRGGTYGDDSLFTTTDGTEEAPITVRSYPGEDAVITGKGIYDQVVHLNNDHYILSGLMFENTRCYNVIYVNSSQHNTIRDCRFLKQPGTMILIRGGGYHTIENNSFDTTGSPKGPGSGDHIYVAGSHHNLILHADEQGDRPGEDPLLFYEQENWGHSLAWAEANFPQHFYKNLEKNPRFVDAPCRDFRLRDDSPAIDRGDFLTRTTAAGENTATVPVGDASLFCDGWGRIEGDLVQVGASPPVRIRKADYDENLLILEAPVSFAEGEPVSLPWDGAAPDLGLGSVRTDSKQAKVRRAEKNYGMFVADNGIEWPSRWPPTRESASCTKSCGASRARPSRLWWRPSRASRNW